MLCSILAESVAVFAFTKLIILRVYCLLFLILVSYARMSFLQSLTWHHFPVVNVSQYTTEENMEHIHTHANMLTTQKVINLYRSCHYLLRVQTNVLRSELRWQRSIVSIDKNILFIYIYIGEWKYESKFCTTRQNDLR